MRFHWAGALAGRAGSPGGAARGAPPPPLIPLLLTTPCRRLFTFTRLNNKSLGGADLAMMASNVVLSALSILPYEQVGVGVGMGVPGWLVGGWMPRQ